MNSSNMFLLVLCLPFALMAMAAASPLTEVDETEDDIKRSMLLQRLLGAADRDVEVQTHFADDSRLRQLAAGFALTPQKRFRPAMQSRSGGMSLCLWKVCPAAPWLVTKRESNY